MSSNSRVRVRSCSPSRYRHTILTRHTGTRDQLCLQVGMLPVALSGCLWCPEACLTSHVQCGDVCISNSSLFGHTGQEAGKAKLYSHHPVTWQITTLLMTKRSKDVPASLLDCAVQTATSHCHMLGDMATGLAVGRSPKDHVTIFVHSSQ